MALDLANLFDPDRPPGEARAAKRTIAQPPLCLVALDLPADWHELWDERAAIMEYEGGLPREHAEALALTDIIKQMRASATSAKDATGAKRMT